MSLLARVTEAGVCHLFVEMAVVLNSSRLGKTVWIYRITSTTIMLCLLSQRSSPVKNVNGEVKSRMLNTHFTASIREGC